MSAYIVGAGCINSIVAYLNLHAGRFWWLKSQFGYDVRRLDDLDRLAGELYALNCDAVDQRYGKGTAERDAKDAPAFKYQAVIRDGVAVYKAACCLHYQCTEGNVPKRPLYKALELIVEVVADRVISHLPGYESAPWGD